MRTFEEKKQSVIDRYEETLAKKNSVNEQFYNGIYDRYTNPVLTRDHIPYFWKYDLSKICIE